MDNKSELLKKKKSLEEKLKNPKLAEYKKMFADGIKEIDKKIEALGKDVVKDVEKVVDKPKAKRKPRAKKKTTTKLTKSEEEKAKADLKKKTGKTEEECEEIIEQYKALRTKAQTRKKKETASAKKDKARVETLKKKGDIIEGTNVKTADATIETTKEEVVEKIDKEVEVVKEKAEKKAEKEVKKEMPKATKTEQKKEVEKKVEKEVKAKTKTIVKRIVIDTSDLINTISDKLGKLDKDSQKEFLIKLRSDVDKLLKKYAIGGLTDGAITTMNVTQSNMSASSVNPTLFEKGGSTMPTESYIVTKKDDRHYNQIGVADYGIETDSKGQEFVTLSFDNGISTYSVEDVNKTYAKGGGIMADGRIVLRDFNGIGGNKNKTYKLIKDDRDSDGKPYYTLIEYPSGNVMAQGDSFEEVNGYANLMSGKFAKGGSTYAKGGMVDAPKIYVADLEAYNNGVLKGEWLDLDDYSDADELMDAIEEVVGENEYAIHDVEGIPSSMYSEYMGREDFEELYEMIELAKDNDLPIDVVIDVVSQYDENIVDSYNGRYDSMREFAEELADEIGIENFNNPEYYVYMTDLDRRLYAQDMADSYVEDIADEDGGKRIIEEAELDTEEFDEADEDRQEEMIDEAREIVYNSYYDNVYDELDDPYYYFVEEQGIYSKEDFFNSNLVRIDYDALADALEQDYVAIDGEDGSVYIFNANYKRGGKVKKGKRSKHSYMQDRRRVSSESWEVAYQKRKRRNKK
ncbi:MAG: antirestriction protein ArdA [Flavobacteriaceae bacterium]